MDTKPNLIIVTGIDCTGKSTLARYISKELSIPLHKMMSIESHSQGEMLNYNLLKGVNYDVVMDGFYMDEVVYAPTYRGYKAQYIKDLEERLLERFNIVLVYTYASVETIMNRQGLLHRPSLELKYLSTLKKYFGDFLDSTLVNKKVIVNTSGNLDSKDLEDFLYTIKLNLDWGERIWYIKEMATMNNILIYVEE